MKTVKLFLIFAAVLSIAFSLFFIFHGEKVQVFQPKGMIAKEELNLILFNVALMLVILLPTFVLLLVTAWKYRASNAKAEYNPEKKYGKLNQFILWSLPSVIVLIMAVYTWKATHQLDPYKRIDPKEQELVIQVVALDWKWLFIYPEQDIATLNYVQFPEKKPIRFELVADGSPMNSFWIPQLSGQIYCMTGMVTPLHVVADGVGSYSGKAAEINGEGYAKMRFIAKSTSEADFDSWVEIVKDSPLQLDHKAYAELLMPSIDHPAAFYSGVEKDLFKTIIMKVNEP
jgi:cytochrome o ubiquinol oxidase subunit II